MSIDAAGHRLPARGGIEQGGQMNGARDLRFFGPARSMGAHDDVIQILERKAWELSGHAASARRDIRAAWKSVD